MVAHFREGGGDAALSAALAVIPEDLPTGVRLRRMKQAVALVTALADLARERPLETVIRTLRDFADTALDQAIAAALGESAPGARPHGSARHPPPHAAPPHRNS